MNASNRLDAGPPHAATVLARIQESPTIFTLQLRFDDTAAQARRRGGHLAPLALGGVLDAGDHVADGIVHHSALTSST